MKYWTFALGLVQDRDRDVRRIELRDEGLDRPRRHRQRGVLERKNLPPTYSAYLAKQAGATFVGVVLCHRCDHVKLLIGEGQRIAIGLHNLGTWHIAPGQLDHGYSLVAADQSPRVVRGYVLKSSTGAATYDVETFHWNLRREPSRELCGLVLLVRIVVTGEQVAVLSFPDALAHCRPVALHFVLGHLTPS